MLTDAQLIEIGKKTLVAREKDKARSRASAQVLKRLKENHLPEYKNLLAEEEAKG